MMGVRADNVSTPAGRVPAAIIRHPYHPLGPDHAGRLEIVSVARGPDGVKAAETQSTERLFPSTRRPRDSRRPRTSPIMRACAG